MPHPAPARRRPWPARWLLPTLIVGLSLSLSAAAQAVRWPTQQWERATPEAQGIASGAVMALLDFGAANGMDSLVVTRRGQLVAEAYYAPFRAGQRHRVNSATKAVVGMLTGIAIAQGRLKGTDERVVDFFGDRSIAALDERKRAITVQHLLDMTSGLDWDEPLANALPASMIEMERSADWVQFVLDRPMAQAPGAGFHYNSGGPHLLAAILARQTGMDVAEYAARHLFGPLGITDWQWRHDPQGVAIGGYGLYLQTPDMAKLGYLYLNGGEWEGVQRVPKAWVERAFRAQVPMNLTPQADWRYGDLWWSPPGHQAAMAVGFNRQLIIVVPHSGLVVATTGRRNYAFQRLLALVDGLAKSDPPLPPDPEANARLARRITELASEPLTVGAAGRRPDESRVPVH